MKLIKPSFEILPQENGLEGVYKQIELAGRTCYKSEDKITEDSAKVFVDRMIKSGHTAMLEHGTIYLGRPVFPDIGLDGEYSYETDGFYKKYIDNKFSHVEVRPFKWSGEDGCYATTNYRVLLENDWLSDLEYLCELTEYHEKRITVRFICDRAIANEFVRHRVFSFAQESTRYCNYSKDKFGNELTFIIPNWVLNEHQIDISLTRSDLVGENNAELLFKQLLSTNEDTYFKLLNNGWKPQQARNILPLCLKTELIMTGFISDWKKFFELRDSEYAHPQAYELAHALHEEFINKKLI